MKFGRQFESESVPEWRIHNIDYNGLKRLIKTNTTRHQASAITIPGHQDEALERFEDELYRELLGQHERVDLFVHSKTAEIRRRLDALSQRVDALVTRCHARDRYSDKRRRLFGRCDRDLTDCRDDIRNLKRFVAAQVVAFRKILKKYKKWTGSSAMGSRFKEQVLSNHKSFTKTDFSHLASQCDHLTSALRTVSPPDSEPPTPSDQSPSTPCQRQGSRSSRQRFASRLELPPPAQPIHYWNEYDDGSEAGDDDGGYVIYTYPEENAAFPGMETLRAFFSAPVREAKKLLGSPNGSKQPLLSTSGSTLTGSPHSYGTLHDPNAAPRPGSGAVSVSQVTDTDAEEEEAFASDTDFPAGYETYYATLPSVESQKIALYRQKALFWGTTGSFLLSLVLLVVAGILINTGRHKVRYEVDAGVITGSVASLCAACAGVWMALLRLDRMPRLESVIVGLLFCAICLLNGSLLVSVSDNFL